jgi:RNA polymerase sigma-70 factor (ECF subfamily)
MMKRHVPIVQTVEDDELVLLAQKGNQRAFERLVAKYSNYVCSIAFNVVGDLHIAGDMAQEAFVKAFRKLQHLDNPRRFKAWLFSIVRSTCIDWLRKERIKPCSLDKISEEEGIEPSDAQRKGQISPELEDLRERLLAVIAQLPKIYQQIVLLKHLRNMSYKEMSEFLGVPVATIESRLYRARLLLKERLQDLYV